MIFAKAMPYSDPTQAGKFYVLWSANQPLINSTDVNGDPITVPDTSFAPYNVSDPLHLSCTGGVITIV